MSHHCYSKSINYVHCYYSLNKHSNLKMNLHHSSQNPTNSHISTTSISHNYHYLHFHPPNHYLPHSPHQSYYSISLNNPVLSSSPITANTITTISINIASSLSTLLSISILVHSISFIPLLSNPLYFSTSISLLIMLSLLILTLLFYFWLSSTTL